MRHDRIVVPAIALLIMASAAGAQETCALGGTVVSGPEAVAGAEVSIPQLGVKTMTDSVGGFRLAIPGCGRRELQVRKIGFTVHRDTIEFAPGQEVTRSISLIAVAQLDTMRTTADEIHYHSPRLFDFETRRKRNVGGHFIGEAEIRKHESSSVPNLMRSRFAGLQFVQYRGMTAAKGSRGSFTPPTYLNPQDARSPRGCWAVVFIDGILIFDGTPRVGQLPPDIGQFTAVSLSGLEYYTSAGSIPLQYKVINNGCGTLLLWTRGR